MAGEGCRAGKIPGAGTRRWRPDSRSLSPGAPGPTGALPQPPALSGVSRFPVARAGRLPRSHPAGPPTGGRLAARGTRSGLAGPRTGCDPAGVSITVPTTSPSWTATKCASLRNPCSVAVHRTCSRTCSTVAAVLQLAWMPASSPGCTGRTLTFMNVMLPARRRSGNRISGCLAGSAPGGNSVALAARRWSDRACDGRFRGDRAGTACPPGRRRPGTGSQRCEVTFCNRHPSCGSPGSGQKRADGERVLPAPDSA